ncbi:hypothetical protein ACWDOP_11605 [Nocardia sp. NPDC003693]
MRSADSSETPDTHATELLPLEAHAPGPRPTAMIRAYLAGTDFRRHRPQIAAVAALVAVTAGVFVAVESRGEDRVGDAVAATSQTSDGVPPAVDAGPEGATLPVTTTRPVTSTRPGTTTRPVTTTRVETTPRVTTLPTTCDATTGTTTTGRGTTTPGATTTGPAIARPPVTPRARTAPSSTTPARMCG